MSGYISYGDMMCMDYFNLQPSDVKGAANISTDYEKRYLLQKLYSVYDFIIPKHWSLAYLRFFLFYYGSIGVFYSRDLGWFLSPYSISKLKMYYLPAVIECYNQFVNRQISGLVGVNAGIIHIMDDRFGLDDLLTRYATQLAEIDKNISVNLMTCGTGYLFLAPNKKAGDTIKEAWCRQSTGEPIVVVDERNVKSRTGEHNRLETFNPDISKNYIVDKLLISRRSLINNFLTEIGINNSNYDKRERLTEAEVERNDEETDSLAHVILHNIRTDFDEINAMSGLGLAVKLRGGESSAKVDIVRDDKLGQ